MPMPEGATVAPNIDAKPVPSAAVMPQIEVARAGFNPSAEGLKIPTNVGDISANLELAAKSPQKIEAIRTFAESEPITSQSTPLKTAAEIASDKFPGKNGTESNITGDEAKSPIQPDHKLTAQEVNSDSQKDVTQTIKNESGQGNQKPDDLESQYTKMPDGRYFDAQTSTFHTEQELRYRQNKSADESGTENPNAASEDKTGSENKYILTNVGKTEDGSPKLEDNIVKSVDAEAPVENKANGQPANAEQTQSEEERQGQMQKYEDDIKTGKITPEDFKKYQELKQNPEQQLADLKDRMIIDPDSITAEDLAKYQELSHQLQDNNLEQLTPEQKAEKLSQECENAGVETFRKMANGDDYSNELKTFNQKYAEMTGQKRSNREAQRDEAFVKGIINPDKNGSKNPKELMIQRQVREKLQELARYEMQLMGLPESLKKLKEQSEKLRQETLAAESKMGKGSKEVQYQSSMEFIGKAQELNNVKAEIVNIRNLGDTINAKRIVTRLEIHRKLGMKSVVSDLLLYGEAFLKGSWSQSKTEIDAYLDY